MRLFRRKNNEHGATAVADRPDTASIRESFDGSTEELHAEIDRLRQENQASPDRDRERRLVHLRHLAGIRRMASNGSAPEYPEPAFDQLPDGPELPEFQRDELTPELVRAAILRDGCVLIRGLVDRDLALEFAGQIDDAFADREQQIAGEPQTPGYYEPYEPEAEFEVEDGTRGWVHQGGGLLAADSPMLAFQMFELFESAQLPDLVGGYLGEPPLVSLNKTTLRKATPDVAGAWHQDGKFMGHVRALNLWLSLSRCGDESPGLDIVPRRLEELVAAQTDEALLDYQVSQKMAEDAAGDKPIVRPIFEPGDALLFDDLFLHKTGSDPSMPKPRYAIENWFFGASAFPETYAPIAV
jgi:hypothetical protein